MGKEEIACNEQFLLFPHCFLLNHITAPPIVLNLDIISLFTAELEESKIGILGKGLITFFRTSFIKFYLNSQQMSDSFYQGIIVKKRVPKHTHSAM